MNSRHCLCIGIVTLLISLCLSCGENLLLFNPSSISKVTKQIPCVTQLDSLSRTASETFTKSGVESEPYPLTSKNADSSTAPIMILPGKDFDYTIYKFTLNTANNYATKYSVTLNKSTSCWVGYSDYEYGVLNSKLPGIWRWKSYTTNAPTLILTYKNTTKPDNLISSKRNFYIAVAAFKNEVQVKSVQLVTKLDSGAAPADVANFTASTDRTDGVFLSWSKSDTADGYYIYRDTQDTQIQNIVGADTINYLDTTVTDLVEHDYWIKAYSTFGDSNLSTAKGKKINIPKNYDSWALHDVDLENSKTTGNYPSMTIINGYPFVVHFATSSTGGLKFARATTSKPSSSSDWVLGYIDTDKSTPMISNVLEIDGKPMVFYSKSLAEKTNYRSWLYCAQAKTATPSGPDDWTLTDLRNDCHVVSGIGAAVLTSGYPAIAYADLKLDVGDIYYNIATTKTPTGVADWTTIKAEKLDPAGMIDEIDNLILLQDGTPAICFHSQKPDKELWFGYPSEVIPTVTSTWSIMKVDTGDVGEFASMCLINNQPAISYYDRTNLKVKYAYASKPKPTSSDTWILITLPDTKKVGAETTSIISLGNKPAIAYLNQEDLSLQFSIANSSTPTKPSDWSIYIVDPNQGGTSQVFMLNIGDLPFIAYGTVLAPPNNVSLLRFAQLK